MLQEVSKFFGILNRGPVELLSDHLFTTAVDIINCGEMAAELFFRISRRLVSALVDETSGRSSTVQ